MEKSEKPSKQKLRKAKERGEIYKSGEFAFALLFLGGVFLLWGFGSLFQRGFKEVFYSLWTQASIDSVFSRAFSPILFPLLSILIGLMIIAIASHLFQSGWIWRLKRKRGKPSRRFFFPLLKWGIIAIVGYLCLRRIEPTPTLLFSTPDDKERFLFREILRLALTVGSALVILGLGDFFYQKWRFQQKMRMTPKELKEEKRETEGDPHVKGKLRERR